MAERFWAGSLLMVVGALAIITSGFLFARNMRGAGVMWLGIGILFVTLGGLTA